MTEQVEAENTGKDGSWKRKTVTDLMAHKDSLHPPVQIPDKPLAGKRIFILEDDVDAMVLVAHVLRNAGATVIFERQGYMTISVLQRILPIDLIILDLNTPGTHGFTAFAKIKALPVLKGIKVVCCTALRDKVNDARDLGFDGFVSKPIQPLEFVKHMVSILEGKQVWVRT